MIDLVYNSELERNQQLIKIFKCISEQIDNESSLGYLNDKIDRILGDFWPMKGHVYILHIGKNLYRIGLTIDIERRLKELKETRVVRTIKSLDILETKKHLHNRFKDKRLIEDQEIFNLNDEDLVYIHNYPDEKLDDSISLF